MPILAKLTHSTALNYLKDREGLEELNKVMGKQCGGLDLRQEVNSVTGSQVCISQARLGH